MRTLLLLVHLALLSANTLAADLKIQLPAGGAVVLPLPDDWNAQTRQTLPGQPDTAQIAPKDPHDMTMLVTVLVAPKGEDFHPTAEDVRASVQRALRSIQPTAVEQNIPVVDMGMRGAPGYYFFATDKHPKPDEYKYLTQGQVGLGDAVMLFTILTNGDPHALSDRALGVVKALRRE
jgi:hypothetical protein